MNRRGAGVVIAIVVAVPLAAGVTYAARSDAGTAETPAAEVPTATARVVRGTLSEHTQLSGILGYTGSFAVDHLGTPGVLTAAPAPGATVGRGGILYRVSDSPVRLLLGAVPVYRDFRYGMSDGPDVRQLEANLAAMGFDPRRRMTVDRHFSAATAAAIRRWEASWGRAAYQRTGRLGQGQVVFLPRPLRVATVAARIGAAVGPGTTVLTGTSTDRAVTAQLDTSGRDTVHVGDKVEVSLPDADPIQGRVTRIGPAAQLPATDPSPGQDPDQATIPVTVAIQLPGGFELDQAPVTVDITTGTRTGVLLLPIAALLARPGGGYQVRLAGGGLVPVELGRFDESSGQVEIVNGVREGQSVEVPAG
ncbi:efflux RND transporter periplasmic adaptor subunit [Actinoplanes sp. TBRC 11911]|uniref:HlyD family efflux transporter periplasmic adaptor subunit n=1 Tax=Actinoplanes sp. TBRC 11911 TaxID=2729386 RepID=UPI00145DA1CB|nr:HlyD family efflux transporter periplasmic adaptor subunit [Actinoplanes sp. TBRC 11911]NMO56865.1 efflux RND transporter periplasmic adaptor subunit [Actinoplanes sp. TBRC 11911]